MLCPKCSESDPLWLKPLTPGYSWHCISCDTDFTSDDIDTYRNEYPDDEDFQT